MSSYTCINITVRRADGDSVSGQDLASFDEAFFSMTWSEKHSYSHVCHNNREMFASGTLFHDFDEMDLDDFARSHPHLQIEVIEEGEYGAFRHLYHGELYEKCDEIRTFEKPVLIDWEV